MAEQLDDVDGGVLDPVALAPLGGDDLVGTRRDDARSLSVSGVREGDLVLRIIDSSGKEHKWEDQPKDPSRWAKLKAWSHREEYARKSENCLLF